MGGSGWVGKCVGRWVDRCVGRWVGTVTKQCVTKSNNTSNNNRLTCMKYDFLQHFTSDLHKLSQSVGWGRGKGVYMYKILT